MLSLLLLIYSHDVSKILTIHLQQINKTRQDKATNGCSISRSRRGGRNNTI